MIAGTLGFVAILVLAFLRVPIAAAMGFVGFFGLVFTRNFNSAVASVVNIIFDAGFQYTLAVIPLFVLMGNFVTRAGMSKELYQASYTFVGHRKGGLAMTTILACAGFGAICGSAVATAATMTKVAHPSMKAHGYSDALSAGSIASGGTLGILIPPSTLMIIYCIITEQNVSEMFSAGFLPGLLGVMLYLLAVRYVVWRDPAAGPPGERSSWRERLSAVKNIWGVLLLFFVVIGGMYTGVFTSTEAAGIGATGGFLFAVFKSKLSLRETHETIVESVRTTAVLFAILMGALIFSSFLNFTDLPNALVEMVSVFAFHPILVILAICALYIVLMSALEELSVILLTVPLFFPLIVSLGYDPIWFGILIVCVVEIGMISPPVGMNLFVINAMMPGVPMGTVWRGVMPFIVADIIRLAILIAFPVISLIIPRWLFG